MIDGWKEDSANPFTTDELFAKYVKLYNDSLKNVPEDMHVGLHICRGTNAP
jgi:methionine synthase II (cobalamin-independent)